MESVKIAIVRVRGNRGVRKEIVDTLRMLRLYKKNSCVIVDNNLTNMGMIKKAKDYITWGEINEETIKLLLKERGKIVGNKPLTSDYLKEKLKKDFDSFSKDFLSGKVSLKSIPGLKLLFRLNPPLNGFERGGIKKPFSMGGVLGYRKDKINDIIKRMI